MDVSIIVCTHNPRPDYLSRTFAALRNQTLPLERWELLVIDNASKLSLAEVWDLSWHPKARHVREKTLGLTAARLRGIVEARGELLVFVDDDNLLAHDYLEQAWAISKDFPNFGAYGGQVRPEFEVPPPEWTKPHWGSLALHEVPRDVWSNLYSYQTAPCGAGMCIRRIIAEHYTQVLASNPVRKQLDRRGTQLISCGDSDIAFTACDLGYGTARFARLAITHLIPVGRLEKKYLLKLSESLAFSDRLLSRLRGFAVHESFRETWKQRLCAWLAPFTRDSFVASVYRGRYHAEKRYRALLLPPSPPSCTR